MLQKLAASIPVLLCTTKLAERRPQKYFALQSLRRGRKGRKGQKGQPLLLHTTKLGHSISQYYFVVQSLREALPCTMSYCKSLQQVTQYYFVLQSLQKVRPSTTSYCKACTGGERGQEGNQYYLELQSLGLPNK